MELQILNMKRAGIISPVMLLLLQILIPACEEVIDIDLNSSNPVVVIEAFIARDSVCVARLEYTTDYFSIGNPPPITDAAVTLSGSNGQSETLVHVGEGIYRGSLIRGEAGISYLIEIDHNGETITAHTSLPEKSEIVTIDAIRSTFTRPGDEPSYLLDIIFSDNPFAENYYMVRIIRNDTLMKGYISLASDFFNNSGKIDYTEWRYDFRSGDRATVELYSIDRDLFVYFSMINEATSPGIGFATPYNPRSNLRGNALGYFGSWSVTSDSIRIN